MKFNNILFYISFLFITCTSAVCAQFIPALHPAIHTEGRIEANHSDSSITSYWSGSSASFMFKGSSISVSMNDEKGLNFYQVLFDDSLFTLNAGKGLHNYFLGYCFDTGYHTIKLFKQSEYVNGRTTITGFEIENFKAIKPTPAKEKEIIYFGNSITAAYAVSDYSGLDNHDSSYTNNYLSYARITADYFNASYQCICKSGIGVVISWFPQNIYDIYDKINPNNPESSYNFADDTPDLVIINLLQNDSWLVEKPEHSEFKRLFGNTKPTDEYMVDAYRKLIENMRVHYPNTPMVCMLGNMDITREGSKWPGMVKQAVNQMNEDKIYTFFQPYKNTPGHPRIEEQQTMAKALIKFLEEEVCW